MNEPKRRGRKPKQAETTEQYNADSVNPEPVQYQPNIAQEYANRVWAGQSDTVSRAERIRRVQAALTGQGLSFEGVKL